MSDQFYRAIERNEDGEWHILDRRQKVTSTHRGLDEALARIALVARAWEESNRKPPQKDVGWAWRELQRVAVEIETLPRWLKNIVENKTS